jgi:hypothetical protein
MKCGDSIFSELKSLILIVVATTGGLFQASYCQSAHHGGVSLLIQQTPVQGGTITPSAGVHQFAPNSQITLVAVPQQGYQFVYWLGDVSDPTGNRTNVFLDGPKVVIAVFEPIEQQYRADGPVLAAGGGRGGIVAAAGDFGQHGSLWLGGGPAALHAQRSSRPTFPAESIPEPATLILLGLGCLIWRRRW